MVSARSQNGTLIDMHSGWTDLFLEELKAFAVSYRELDVSSQASCSV